MSETSRTPAGFISTCQDRSGRSPTSQTFPRLVCELLKTCHVFHYIYLVSDKIDVMEFGRNQTSNFSTGFTSRLHRCISLSESTPVMILQLINVSVFIVVCVFLF